MVDFLLAVVSILAFVALGYVFYVVWSKARRHEGAIYDNKDDRDIGEFTHKNKYWLLPVIGIAMFAIFFLNMCTTRVQPGYNGITYSLATGLKEDVKKPGLKVHWPWETVYDYPTSTETIYLKKPKKDDGEDDKSFSVNTNDGKSVDVDAVYAYHMESDKLPHIFARFRRQPSTWIEENYIKQEVSNYVQAATTKYSVLEVYSHKRSDITAEIKKNLAKSLKEDGIVLEKFTIADVRPGKETTKKLQAIADMQNEQERLAREEQVKRQQAANNKIEAEGQKVTEIINAERDAEKIRINADAQAQANEKLKNSLSPEVIQSQWINRWNGQKSLVEGGSSSIINMPADIIKQQLEQGAKK